MNRRSRREWERTEDLGERPLPPVGLGHYLVMFIRFASRRVGRIIERMDRWQARR